MLRTRHVRRLLADRGCHWHLASGAAGTRYSIPGDAPPSLHSVAPAVVAVAPCNRSKSPPRRHLRLSVAKNA